MNKIFQTIAAQINAVIYIGSEAEARRFAESNADAVGVYRYSNSRDFYGFYFSNQRVYKDFMYELKKRATVGVQRTYFVDSLIHVLCPVSEYDANYYGGADKVFYRDDELADNAVAFCIWDTALKAVRFIPAADSAKLASLDTNRYRVTDYIRFWRNANGKVVAIHKNDYTAQWATANRYKLICDTTANGGFDYAVTINGTAHSGTVAWSAGATLASIVAQITDVVATYFVVSSEAGEDFIRVTTQGYSNSTFTITNATGATVDDLSKYCKIAGELQEESHRTWQAQDVHTLFPNSGFNAANTVQYARNGYNLSYMCGANFAQYKYYYGVSGSGHGGSDTYIAENAVSSRMSQVGFNACNGSGVAEQQALYDKYNGDYDAYLMASMFAIGDTHTNGINYQSYDNGDAQSEFLASVETMTYDGTYIHAYPAAAAAKALKDADFASGNMPTNTEIAVMNLDDNKAAINAAISALGGTAIGATSWSVAQFYAIYAWLYYSTYGSIVNDGKHNSNHGRALAYLTKISFLNL